MADLKRTPLHSRHCDSGAKMVDFGGWDMPVEYSGLADEHAAVRTKAGLFDVSHMGEVYVSGSGACAFLDGLVPTSVAKLPAGRIQYTGLLYENGGFVDDLLIYCEAPDRYLLVVNASNIQKDVEWLARHLPSSGVAMENKSADTALIALQGPRAEAILGPLTTIELPRMKYYGFERGVVAGHGTIVSRTGYTGEDGFEIYCAPEDAVDLWDALLEEGQPHGLIPAGLGARDTLRLEARMPLYGNDIDADTTPFEADLGFIVKLKDKGDFVGRATLEQQQSRGVRRRLVGFELEGRGIARHGYDVEIGGKVVGQVTSGTKTPTVGKAIGLAYLPIESAAVDSVFAVKIRDKSVPARVVPTPFYKRKK